MVVEFTLRFVRGGPLEEKILASQSVSQMTSLMELTTAWGDFCHSGSLLNCQTMQTIT